jgi:hypothetical protein
MRMVGHMAAWAAAVALAALPVAGMAQAGSTIPNQGWYPEGYLDLREAAARQVEKFPREERALLMEDWDDPDRETYDLIDCNAGVDLPAGMSPREEVLSLLALEIARFRSEFARVGYRRDVYDEPLLAYERAALAELEAEDLSEDEGVYLEDIAGGYELLEELEARRQRLQPDKPSFVSEGGCGAGESEFAIRLSPANGELWLINAFAFRVCERKVANPWDHNACGWTQYQEGDSTFASGRYMYEARWGSTVKRGSRELQGDPADEDVTQITFRR